MIVNLNKGENVKTILFPDNQPHITLPLPLSDEYNVICSITDSQKLFELLQLSEAIDGGFGKKRNLYLPYLLTARFDRRMNVGDSFDLKVLARLVNMCEFEKVFLYDTHSDVSSALIENSVNITNQFLIETYKQENALLICPDAGAAKKIKNYFDWNKNLVDIIYVHKDRNPKDGSLKIRVLEPEKTLNRNCIIIDDLCDGGGTFNGIASQLHQPKHLTLMVTHGVFSQGFSKLKENFEEIIVSDSYNKTYNEPFVTQIPCSYV